MNSLKKPFYSALVFFGTLIVLSVGYSLVGNLSVADKVGSGSGLTASAWNKIIDGVLDLDSRLSNLSFVGGKVGIGTTTPSTALEVNGIITAANLNQDPILSTQPSGRYSVTTTPGAWNYTGESITITVPAGPNRRYRVVNRQLVNCNTSGQGITILSNSSTAVNYSWQIGGSPHFAYTASIWQTVSSEGIITLAPGTYTYYVMIYTGTACALQVANASSDGRNYSNVYFDPK